MNRRYITIIVIALLLAVLIIVYLLKDTSSDSTPIVVDTASTSTTVETPSSDEIFSEASSQLGFSRDQVTNFSIYSADKVQYSFGNGTTFAYKYNGSWHIAGPASSQEVPLCSTLTEVPEQYRQACYEPATDTNLYVDDAGQNLHYSYKQRTAYIGQ